MTRSLRENERCPLTVIGGFLGAGKTTLVNRLLATARERTAVLVNDFGAVNVDASLIAAHDGETLRLTNGCVCCSMNDDFMGTLIRVLDAPDRFDHIVIEASGVGDPWAIAEIALIEPQLRLNAVIVLADAERISGLLADPRVGAIVARQIKAADLILLNKTDLVSAAAIGKATDALAALKPDARIIPVTNAEIPFNIYDAGHDSHDRPSHFAANGVDHETIFSRALYRRAGAFDRTALTRALNSLPSVLLRLKGQCAVAGSDRPCLLQAVGARWSLTPAVAPISAIPIELVGIGFGSNLDETLSHCLDPALLLKGKSHDDDL